MTTDVTTTSPQQPTPTLPRDYFNTTNVQTMDDVIVGLNLILDAFMDYLDSIETVGTESYFVFKKPPTSTEPSA